MGRTASVPVLLSSLEFDLLTAAAKQAGVSLSVYLRTAGLKAARVTVADHRPTYTREQLSSLYKRESRRGKVWTEAELKRRGLPLYWCEEWVRRRLEAGWSRVDLAVEAGVHEATLSGFLRRVYDLRVFGVPDEPLSRRERARALYQQGRSYAEIARMLDLSEGTVRRYTGGLGREFDRRSEQAFHAVMARVQDWDGTRAQVAERAFDGNEQAATYWLRLQVREGRLERVQRGRYVVKRPGDEKESYQED